MGLRLKARPSIYPLICLFYPCAHAWLRQFSGLQGMAYIETKADRICSHLQLCDSKTCRGKPSVESLSSFLYLLIFKHLLGALTREQFCRSLSHLCSRLLCLPVAGLLLRNDRYILVSKAA